MENLWAETIDENEENKVEVQIMPIYGDDSQRPTEFFVQYRINDGKWVEESFENERSQ